MKRQNEMSPSSSAVPQIELARGSNPHSRNNSASTPQTQENKSSKLPVQETHTAAQKPQPHYTVFIRLPFPRNDFEDPPLVEWDTAKDKALWKLISKASNSKDLSWDEMSVKFNVSLPFLLQQAAWLYERHFEGMKAQMKKLGVSGAASPTMPLGESGAAPSTPIGGVPMQKTGSKDSRMPPSINTLKQNPLPHGDIVSSPGTPRSTRPIVSRTPSTTTVTQSRVLLPTPNQSQRAPRGSGGSQRRPAALSRATERVQVGNDEYVLGHDGVSESDSEEEPSAAARSSASRRLPSTVKPKATAESDGDAEDDEDDSPGGFLPFATTSKPGKDEMAATLRSSPKREVTVPQIATTAKGKSKQPPPDSSASSSNSAQQLPSTSSKNSTNPRPGPLSPTHRAELEKLSPRYKKSGSEGSPSMGSSFSDLDDASITQSALEDALLSNMQHGSIGMGSRMSSLRDALGRK